jgi:hypothetical protein
MRTRADENNKESKIILANRARASILLCQVLAE